MRIFFFAFNPDSGDVRVWLSDCVACCICWLGTEFCGLLSGENGGERRIAGYRIQRMREICFRIWPIWSMDR